MEFFRDRASLEFGAMLYLLELERERMDGGRIFDESTVVFNGRTYHTRPLRRPRPASPPLDPDTLMRTWLPMPASWLPTPRSSTSSSPQGQHAAAAPARSNKRARVPASDEAMRGLRVVTCSSGEECAICLQGLDFHADPDGTPTLIRAMPCSHAFHQRCIFDWLRRNAVCPLCRFQLPTEEEEEEETGGAGETQIQEDRRRTAILWEHYRRTRRVPSSSSS